MISRQQAPRLWVKWQWTEKANSSAACATSVWEFFKEWTEALSSDFWDRQHWSFGAELVGNTAICAENRLQHVKEEATETDWMATLDILDCNVGDLWARW